MERGVCMRRVVSEEEVQPKALERYLVQRFPRPGRVQLMSRAIGEHIYHPAGEHARLRNAIMRAKTSEDYYGHLAWLYGGTGLAGEKTPPPPRQTHRARGCAPEYRLPPPRAPHPPAPCFKKH